ncbi:PP2C family protein-serine/threonine phosphatase [Nocardioides litoris]|uniref:PP2C family protein-serine/threonine phosphatase n=1 Tax=Nocardioides litoris TaxID=1926648 RepID=UPI001476DB7F|nr:PP2C family protein-serine/threonine phosphatase [Nocardioides litoris]
MPTSPHAVALLLERAARRPAGELARVVSEVAHEVWGAGGAAVYLVTLEQTELVPLGLSRREAFTLEDGPACRSFTLGRTVVEPGQPVTTWTPLTHRGHRLGLLGLVAAASPPEVELRPFADAVALLLVADSRSDDTADAVRRTQELTAGAELMGSLAPPASYVDERVSLAAVAEPSYAAGGDAFDHALDGDLLRAMVVDATGHGNGAAVVSAVAVAAYRSARRAGEDLLGTWAALERHVGEIGTTDQDLRFATAVLVEVHLGTGRVAWVSAGHPFPVVVRADGDAAQLEGDPAPPLGTGLGVAPEVQEEYLEPGDVLALHTDGITEARDLDGTQLGTEGWLEVLHTELAVGGLLAERLRRLRLDLLARDDAWLADDATALLVEWHGST